MKLCFITPPALDNQTPAERSAGCTRIVYHMPNIYELTLIAAVEAAGLCEVARKDFVKEGLTPQDFTEWIAGNPADAYVVWTVNLSIPTDLAARSIIAEHQPDAFMIWTGPGATYFTDKCLSHDTDIVVRGEPEVSFVQLLKHLADSTPWTGTPGISFIDNHGSLHHNPANPPIDNLDELPFPARHHIALTQYHNPKLKRGPYTSMFTSRNCPYRCIYCVPSSLTFAREIEYKRSHPGIKPPVRIRSVENVQRELELLHSQGYRAIGFMDDNFIWNEERTRQIAAVLKRLGMVWGCQARVDAITETIAQILADSGCQYVDLGVESFTPEILEYIKKGITVEQIYSAVNLLKKYRVPVKLNVLIGSSPLETRHTIKHTLREAKRLKVDQVMFNIVSPFPGTEFYQMAKDGGWLTEPDYVPTDVQRESILNYPHLSAREMEQLLFRNNLSFFLDPRVIFSHIRKFRSFGEFVHALHGLKVKLFG